MIDIYNPHPLIINPPNLIPISYHHHLLSLPSLPSSSSSSSSSSPSPLRPPRHHRPAPILLLPSAIMPAVQALHALFLCPPTPPSIEGGVGGAAVSSLCRGRSLNDQRREGGREGGSGSGSGSGLQLESRGGVGLGLSLSGVNM